MRSIVPPWVLIVLCTLVGPASAAHVTDKLVIGLYGEPVVEGSPRRLLTSGTPLEVLETRAGFSHVRLADTTEGWVETDYVTEEKPAKAVLLETQARLRQMGLELAALRERQGGDEQGSVAPADSPLPSAGSALLRRSLDQAQAQIAELEKQLTGRPLAEAGALRLAELESRVRQATELLLEAQGLEVPELQTMRAGPISRNQSWIVALIALLLGFGAGAAFIDYRIRRRHGGFRV